MSICQTPSVEFIQWYRLSNKQFFTVHFLRPKQSVKGGILCPGETSERQNRIITPRPLLTEDINKNAPAAPLLGRAMCA
jgi:hypothetical protein